MIRRDCPLTAVRSLLTLAVFCCGVPGVSHDVAAEVFQTPLAVAPDDFRIRCFITDPATGQAITSLTPGDPARASATIRIGETVAANKITITGTASAAVYGYDLKLQLGQTVLEIPPVGQRDELLQLYATEPTSLPTSYGQRFRYDFTVPDKWPSSRVTVKLVATVEGIGSRNCSKTLEVL